MSRFVALEVALLSCLVLSCASEATTLHELRVSVRILDFLTESSRGKVPVAVVYDARNKASVEDAQTILGWLNSEVSSGKIELSPSLFDVHQLDEASSYRFAVVANATEANFDLILAFSRKNHVLTVSSDLSCMRSGNCVVGIASNPRIEVTINRAVASSCGVAFSEAFRMMVREY
jgi:hypothetical protein